MSIWANLKHIGTDKRMHGRPVDNRGTVLSYAAGFSSHYPEVDGRYEQPSSLLLSTIPAWCVPGHEGEEGFDASGPWLRLDVNSHEHDDQGHPTGARKSASIVIDIDAARSLARDLLEWADRDHVFPALVE